MSGKLPDHGERERKKNCPALSLYTCTYAYTRFWTTASIERVSLPPLILIIAAHSPKTCLDLFIFRGVLADAEQMHAQRTTIASLLRCYTYLTRSRVKCEFKPPLNTFLRVHAISLICYISHKPFTFSVIHQNLMTELSADVSFTFLHIHYTHTRSATRLFLTCNSIDPLNTFYT